MDEVILFESEVSSRLYRYNTIKSDYDKQGIYIPDSISLLREFNNKEDSFKKHYFKDEYEITEVYHHINKICDRILHSNLNTYEMLFSDIIYTNIIPDEISKVKGIFSKCFNINKMLHQYNGIMTSNFKDIVSNKDWNKTVKSLIQFYRTAISFQYVYNIKKLPPLKISELCETGFIFSNELKQVVSARQEDKIEDVTLNLDFINDFQKLNSTYIKYENDIEKMELYEAVKDFSYNIKSKLLFGKIK